MKFLMFFISAVQRLLLILMAPLTLALCAGVVICTYLITRQLRRSAQDRRPVNVAQEQLEWTGLSAAEWLGA